MQAGHGLARGSAAHHRRASVGEGKDSRFVLRRRQRQQRPAPVETLSKINKDVVFGTRHVYGTCMACMLHVCCCLTGIMVPSWLAVSLAHRAPSTALWFPNGAATATIPHLFPPQLDGATAATVGGDSVIPRLFANDTVDSQTP